MKKKALINEVRQFKKIAGLLKEDRFYVPDYLLQILGSQEAVDKLIQQFEEDHATEEDPEGDNARDYLLSIDNPEELTDVLKDYLPNGELEEDYNKPSEEHVRKYWSTMVEHQPEDVINTLVNLTTGQTSIESFTRSTMNDVFDSYRDDLYSNELEEEVGGKVSIATKAIKGKDGKTYNVLTFYGNTRHGISGQTYAFKSPVTLTGTVSQELPDEGFSEVKLDPGYENIEVTSFIKNPKDGNHLLGEPLPLSRIYQIFKGHTGFSTRDLQNS